MNAVNDCKLKDCTCSIIFLKPFTKTLDCFPDQTKQKAVSLVGHGFLALMTRQEDPTGKLVHLKQLYGLILAGCTNPQQQYPPWLMIQHEHLPLH